jgi:hypothetical protein
MMEAQLSCPAHKVEGSFISIRCPIPNGSHTSKIDKPNPLQIPNTIYSLSQRTKTALNA